MEAVVSAAEPLVTVPPLFMTMPLLSAWIEPKLVIVPALPSIRIPTDAPTIAAVLSVALPLVIVTPSFMRTP